MGYCYEFGLAIHEDCGHAMRVIAAGGACACPTCGVVCAGRFEGCAAILEQPGYVPVTAPHWSVAQLDPPAPTSTRRNRDSFATRPLESATGASVDLLAEIRRELDTTKADLHTTIAKALGTRPEHDADLLAEIQRQLDTTKADLHTTIAKALGTRPEHDADLLAEIQRQLDTTKADLRTSIAETLDVQPDESTDELIAEISRVHDSTRADLRAAIADALDSTEIDDSVLCDAMTEAIERAQQRLIDTMRAQLAQAVRPAVNNVRVELLSAIDTVRFDLSARDKEMVEAFDRLSDSYAALAAIIEGARSLHDGQIGSEDGRHDGVDSDMMGRFERS